MYHIGFQLISIDSKPPKGGFCKDRDHNPPLLVCTAIVTFVERMWGCGELEYGGAAYTEGEA